MIMDLINKAKRLMLKYKSKSNFKYNIELHCKLMIDYGLRKPKNKEFDSESYQIACWIHDIGRLSEKDDPKDREKHKEISLEIFDKEFSHLIDNKIKKKIIKSCILEHSGPIISDNYPELLTIREADRISFLYPEFVKSVFKNFGKEKAKELLDLNYKEFLSINPSKYARDFSIKLKKESEKVII